MSPFLVTITLAVLERPQHPVDDLQRALGQQPVTLLEQVPHGAAVNELHDDVWHRYTSRHILARVVDGHDRRMVQRGRGLRLATEPRLERLISREVRTQRLYRHDSIQPDVTGPVHLGHATTPDDAVELVAATEQPGLCHVSHCAKPPCVVPVIVRPSRPLL
jgi:hypothetical protein